MTATNGGFHSQCARAMLNRPLELTSTELFILRKAAKNGLTYEEAIESVPRMSVYNVENSKQKLKREFNIRFETMLSRRKRAREERTIDLRNYGAQIQINSKKALDLISKNGILST